MLSVPFSTSLVALIKLFGLRDQTCCYLGLPPQRILALSPVAPDLADISLDVLLLTFTAVAALLFTISALE